MHTFIEHIANTLETLNEWVGRSVSWLTSLLVLLFCFDVFVRYVLNATQPAIFELEWHLFAIIFLLGAGYTLKHDKHVRVDVFYAQWSPRRKALVNLVGVLLFLLPFCWIVVQASVPYIKTSWLMNERSSDPGGLPARYLTKSSILVGFLFLGLQALALALRSLLVLLGKERSGHSAKNT